MKPESMAVSLLRRFRFRESSEKYFFFDGGVTSEQRLVYRPGDQVLAATKKSLERILTENILPFWYPRVIDTKDGGYRLNHDLEGRWRGPASKHLVTQARTVWFFSRLVNSDYERSEYLKAARHGYEFLCDRLWDNNFGGFYWQVDSTGHTAIQSDKRMYGQAFGLYALTEYAIASGDSSAKARARELFGLMEAKAHDVEYGGYRDILERDWTPLSSIRVAHARDRVPVKRMNTHLHLLEAITTFVALTGDPTARERLIELILVNSNSVVRKDIGACTEKYLENWQPFDRRNDQRVSYGHDIENVWLLMEASKVAGISGSLLLDLYRTLFRYALEYGFDRRDGGFYDSGPFHAPADRREKIWWVQAEGLVASLQMYKLTGEPLYWDCFTLVLDWIVKHQVDWKHGDWYEIVDDQGRASAVKAGPWKGPYHNGRAMLRCLDLLA